MIKTPLKFFENCIMEVCITGYSVIGNSVYNTWVSSQTHLKFPSTNAIINCCNS